MKIDEDIEITIAGVWKWDELRDNIVRQLKKSDTEEKFHDVLRTLIFATSGSEKEMQKKRRDLGIPET